MSTSVQELYGEFWSSGNDELEEVLDESLGPRGPEMLFERFGDLGVRPGELVLDLGGRDGRYSVELVARFDVRVLLVDPVHRHLGLAADRIAAAGLRGRITTDLAEMESLPIGAESIDHIWCRDVLNHVDLTRGLAECARVLRPGGGMLVYQTFATALLEPNEARRLYNAMAIVSENMSPSSFERAARRAGFLISETDPIDSEWRELWIEGGDTELMQSLLRIARLRRSRESLLHRYPERQLEALLAGRLWGIYQMLGKLCPTLYLLRKPLV